MMFFYRPGAKLIWSLFWCIGSAFVVYSIIFNPPIPGKILWFPIVAGSIAFVVAVAFVATSSVWLWLGFTRFFTMAWGRR